MKLLSLFHEYILDVHDYKSVLLDWFLAVEAFYMSYSQVRACIDQRGTEQCLNTTYVGQCSVSQLMTLVTVMEKELEKLIDDIDQSLELEQSTTSKRYKKLLTHAQVLNHLSQEARRLLLLADCIAN